MHRLDRQAKIQQMQAELQETDHILVRFLEDLILLLVNKGVLQLKDIPREIRAIIAKRKRLRLELNTLLQED